MGARYLTDLADVCRSAGLAVVEVDDWPRRARGSGGYDSLKPDHVMVHHTASGPGSDGWPDVNYCTYGDDDAPLCNLYLARTGEVYVCAAGATNTNGSGDCPHLPSDTMNSSAIGIEAGNDGQGEPWAPVQCTAYLLLVGALCAAYAIPIDHVHSHAEWAPSRKVDPAGPSPWAVSGTWDMDAFRADLGTPPPEPAPAPAQTERRKGMSDFVVVYGEDPFPDGAVYEIINGRKRWLDPNEWTEVLKGVVMDPAGVVPDHQPWQPVAFVANGWGLNGLPDWSP